MNMPTLGELKPVLAELEQELDLFAGENLDLNYKDRLTNLADYNLADYLYGYLGQASRIASHGTRTVGLSTPAFDLVKAAVHLGNLPNPVTTLSTQSILDFACFEFEPRLLKSLDRHRRSRPQNNQYPAAVVLFGTDDEPFAYQKTSGIPTAYAWREAEIATQEGARSVPMGAVLLLDFAAGHEPREVYRGHNLGIVALRKKKYIPYAIEMLRFSTETFPRVVTDYMCSPVHTGAAQKIGQRVNRMLAKDKAVDA